MKSFRNIIVCFFVLLFSLFSCEYRRTNKNIIAAKQSILDTSKAQITEIEKIDSSIIAPIDTIMLDSAINPKPIVMQPIAAKPKALEVVTFAKSLLKTPYVYGGKSPKTGFDSSGFISFVFNHFNITLPATANEFSSVGKIIPLTEASEGDLILISKSEFDNKIVGYVGIVTSSKGAPIEFIYANSGKVKAVIISPYNSYYQKRLIKVVSILP